MSISTTYLLNVALHAAILSVFSSLVLLVLRQARHRSVAAIVGLLSVGFLPWLTALRPVQPVIAPVAEIQTQDAPALPTWTVMTVPAQQKAASVPAPAPEKFVFPDPLILFVTIWAAGAGIGLLLLTIASLKVRNWRKLLVRPDDTTWQTLQSRSPGIPARQHFRLSETHASPCVTGFFQPVIVLPRFVLASQEGLRWAVRHEIAHWQAGDSRWMILFALIRCVNWWNPIVHHLVSQWADAREQLCDLAATGISDSRADYGEFLVAMVAKVSKQPPLAVAMAKRRHAARLKQRIVSLLDATANSGNPVGRRFIAFSSATFIAFAALVSSIKINAEEPAAKLPAIAETVISNRGTIMLQSRCWAVLSTAKPVPNNGQIIGSTQISDLLENLKKRGSVVLDPRRTLNHKFGDPFQFNIVQPTRKQPGEPVSKFIPEMTEIFRNNISVDGKGTLDSNRVNMTYHVSYNYVDGNGLPSPNKQPRPFADWNDFKNQLKSKSGDAKASLKTGESVWIDLGETEPGVYLQIIAQVVPVYVFKALDSGEDQEVQLDSFSEVVKIPSKGVKGNLRLGAMLVTAPIDVAKEMGFATPGFSKWLFSKICG